jgi:hypothetical protein
VEIIMSPLTRAVINNEDEEEEEEVDDEEDIFEEEIITDDDDEEYIIEEIYSDEEEIIEEEIIEEEVTEEEEEEVDEDEICGNDGSYSATFDDDSSAPALSVDSDAPAAHDKDLGRSFREDAGVDLLTRKRATIQHELQKAAESDGARKAKEEEHERENARARQTAAEVAAGQQEEPLHVRLEKEAHKRQQAEEEVARYKEDAQEDGRRRHRESLQRQREQDEGARVRLADEIRKVDIALARKRETVAQTRIQGAAEVEKRKKALAELRRQAAREELSRNNSALKAAKASRGVASVGVSSDNNSATTAPVSSSNPVIVPPTSPTASAPSGLLRATPPTNDASMLDPVVPLPLAPDSLNEQVGNDYNDASNITTIKTSHTDTVDGEASDNDENSNASKVKSSQQAQQKPEIRVGARQEETANETKSLNRATETGKETPALTSPIKSVGQTAVRRSSHQPASPLPRDPKKTPLSSPTITTPRRKASIPLAFSSPTADLPDAFKVARRISLANTKPEVPKIFVSGGNFYSIDDLRKKKTPGLDNSFNRELYLSPEEFEYHFKMSKEDFAKLPKWKQDKAKRALRIF